MSLTYYDNHPGVGLELPGMLAVAAPQRTGGRWRVTVILREMVHADTEGDTYHDTEDEARSALVRRAKDMYAHVVEERTEAIKRAEKALHEAMTAYVDLAAAAR